MIDRVRNASTRLLYKHCTQRKMAGLHWWEEEGEVASTSLRRTLPLGARTPAAFMLARNDSLSACAIGALSHSQSHFTPTIQWHRHRPPDTVPHAYHQYHGACSRTHGRHRHGIHSHHSFSLHSTKHKFEQQHSPPQPRNTSEKMSRPHRKGRKRKQHMKSQI